MNETTTYKPIANVSLCHMHLFASLRLVNCSQVLLKSQVSFYPSAWPGVEERVVVPEAGASLTIASWIPRVCFQWRRIQWWLDQEGYGIQWPDQTKTLVRIRPRSNLQRLPGSPGQRWRTVSGTRCQTVSQTPLAPRLLLHAHRLHSLLQRAMVELEIYIGQG